MTSKHTIIIFMFILCGTSTKFTTSAFFNTTCDTPHPPNEPPINQQDINLLQFAVNLEYLEAEFFLWGALGYGLERAAPELLSEGGPPPIGATKANLDGLTETIVTEFAYQEVGHLRALKETVGLIPRPLLDLSARNFDVIMGEALGHRLEPPFNPYRDGLSYMLASYVIPYMGLVGYVGANPLLNGYKSKRLLAGLLGVEAGQDAVIRTYLFERAKQVVEPYDFTVAEATVHISDLRNRLAMCGIKDEGLIVPRWLGAEMKISTNVLSANKYSLSYRRTPAEILRVVYGTGNERIPGGFYPRGANGEIAQELLGHP